MSATILSPGFKAFETVELLSLICLYSKPSYCIQIMLASKPGFEVAALFVWNHVDGAINLLSLLPAARALRDETEDISVIVSCFAWFCYFLSKPTSE